MNKGKVLRANDRSNFAIAHFALFLLHSREGRASVDLSSDTWRNLWDTCEPACPNVQHFCIDL